MAEILLSSEAFVKSVTSASDNLSGKYILPSLREAQEIGLRGILGDDLLAKLKDLIKNGTLEMMVKIHSGLSFMFRSIVVQKLLICKAIKVS